MFLFDEPSRLIPKLAALSATCLASPDSASPYVKFPVLDSFHPASQDTMDTTGQELKGRAEEES